MAGIICQFVTGSRIEPKEEFLSQFRKEDWVRQLFVSGTPVAEYKSQEDTDGEKNPNFWVELVDDAGHKVVGPFDNTLFSTNWIKVA
ncbi:MAG: hypothetical protein AAB355_03055 [Patescibacteria group bacterium]